MATSRWTRWARWQSHPRAVAGAAAAAIVLCLPALATGLLMDDYAHRMIMLGVAGTPVGPLSVFANFDGDPELNRWYMDRGILPWWAAPDYRLAFSRVLSAASMWIDYRLWPDSPLLMHAHSLLWLAAMVVAAGLLYRRLFVPGPVAGLAVVLFALDDAHAMAATWIANRNALIATTLGLLALVAHDRWRRDGWRWGAAASALCLALALLAGETAVGAVAFLGAWALTLEEGPLRRRVASLLPAAAVVLAWAAYYRLANLGAHGSGLYLDPGDGPSTFIVAILERAPVLMMGQWSPVPAEAATLVSPQTARMLYVAAWLLIAALAVVFGPLLRRERTARFLALGMLFALVPGTGTFPANRLLTFVGFGAMGLVAMFLGGLGERKPRPVEKAMALFLVITHLVVAPLLTPVTAYAMKIYGAPMEAAADSLPSTPDIADQDLIVVTSPDYLTYVCFLPPIQHARGEPLPRRMIGLLAGEVGAEVSRPDAHTLRVATHGGLFDGFLGLLFRDRGSPFRAGDTVDLEQMRVEVLAADESGQPIELLFRFPVPLEDPSLRWITWEGRRYVPFTPPAIGETTSVGKPPNANSLSLPG